LLTSGAFYQSKQEQNCNFWLFIS